MNIQLLSERRNKKISHNCSNCSNYNISMNYCALFKYSIGKEYRAKKPSRADRKNRCHKWTFKRPRISGFITIYDVQWLQTYMLYNEMKYIYFHQARKVFGLSYYGSRDVIRRMVRAGVLQYIEEISKLRKTIVRKYYINPELSTAIKSGIDLMHIKILKEP